MNVDTGELRRIAGLEELLSNEVLVQGQDALVKRLSDNVASSSESEQARRVSELWAAHEERMARKAMRDRAAASGLVLPEDSAS